MIDTEKNIIHFGYGDIAVSHMANTLSITPFKPPQEVGSEVNMAAVDITGPTIRFSFNSLKEIKTFKDSLNLINSTNHSFAFKDYIFDFTQYDEKSKMVLELNLNAIKNHIISLMAC